jgi:hypothetical protein
MKAENILIGGGGRCKSRIDVIESSGYFIIKGILDIPEKLGELVNRIVLSCFYRGNS